MRSTPYRAFKVPVVGRMNKVWVKSEPNESVQCSATLPVWVDGKVMITLGR